VPQRAAAAAVAPHDASAFRAATSVALALTVANATATGPEFRFTLQAAAAFAVAHTTSPAAPCDSTQNTTQIAARRFHMGSSPSLPARQSTQCSQQEHSIARTHPVWLRSIFRIFHSGLSAVAAQRLARMSILGAAALTF
jgi:hypothetical protein